MQKIITSLEQVRFYLEKKASQSTTTHAYQADVFETMLGCLNVGDAVIEVGAYKGGLSCQLAFLLENTDKKLILIDVSSERLDWIKTLIEEMGIETEVEYFAGTLQEFLSSNAETVPSFIVLGGMLSHTSVTDEIEVIKQMKHRPPAVAFQGMSLRHARCPRALEKRLDQAVAEGLLREGHRYKLIGASGDSTGLRTVLDVSDEKRNRYHDRTCSEGLLVVTDEAKFTSCCLWMWKETEVWPDFQQ